LPATMSIEVAMPRSPVMSVPARDPIVPTTVPTTLDSITPGELRMHLQFLACEELCGRYTLSPGFAIAARYLAAHLEAYGFKGAGDNGGFLQTFQVVSSKPDTAKSALEITTSGGTATSYHFGAFSMPDAGRKGYVTG